MDEKVDISDVRVWAEGIGEDEALCDKCEGLGYIFLDEGDEGYLGFGDGPAMSPCPKCEGGGKVDWVKAAMNYGSPKKPVTKKPKKYTAKYIPF